MLTRLLVVILVGGLLPLGASLWWPLELSTHFRLQYLAIAAAALLAGIVFRRRILVAGLGMVIALNAWPLLPYLPRGTARESGMTFTVLNLNANAGNTDHDRVLAAIRRAQADSVTLIELSPALDARLDELSDLYPYSYRYPADGNFGLAVLSRHPLTTTSTLALETTSAISSRIEAPGGAIRLVAVHLVPPVSGGLAARRNRQLETLAELARSTDDTLLICGDFNLSPYSPYFTRFEAAARVRDTRKGHGLRMSWPSRIPLLGIPIDHCFVRGALAPAGIETMDQTGSDHYPVRVQLRWRERE